MSFTVENAITSDGAEQLVRESKILLCYRFLIKRITSFYIK